MNQSLGLKFYKIIRPVFLNAKLRIFGGRSSVGRAWIVIPVVVGSGHRPPQRISMKFSFNRKAEINQSINIVVASKT